MEASPFFAGWRHCPRCGSDRLELDRTTATCPDCGMTLYANPAPTVSVLLLDPDGRVLLGRRANEPGAGRWDVLGGFVEDGEEALDALSRELREELAVEIDTDDFVGAFPDNYADDGPATLNLYWTGRIVSGEPTLDEEELEEVRWFALDELPPPEEFAFDNNVVALKAWARELGRLSPKDRPFGP